MNINIVSWAPSKSGNYQQEISLATLCCVKEAAAVLGRSYACVEKLGELCDMNFKSVVEQTCWANS